MTDISFLLRDHIKKLIPYSSARDDKFSGSAHIFLDEQNSWFNCNAGNNRYLIHTRLKK
jgi:hypothetical protein